MKLLMVCVLAGTAMAGTAMADAPPARNAAMTPENLAKFEKACDAGTATACFDAGMRILSPTKDGPTALPWFEKGCKRDDNDSCALLASLVGSGKYGVKPDKARAFGIHVKLCPKVPNECFLLASYYKNGDYVAKDQKKVLELLKAGCDRGDKQSCDALASETAH